MMDKTNEEYLNCKCPTCGKRFHLKPYRIKRTKNNYCSKECHYKAKEEYMKGSGNHQYGLKGKDNPTWISDRKISRYGYMQRRVLDHPFRDHAGFVFEHRLIAEKYLLTDENSVEIDGKRYLAQGYVVHHINFDRTDNRIENLKIMTKSEHQSYHAKLNSLERDKDGKFMKGNKNIRIKKVSETAIIPKKATYGSAGYDLFVDTDKEIEVKPHETVMLQTNIAFEIKNGMYGAVFARSGLSTRHGIRPATCVSVIDPDYRGSVGVPLHNDSEETYIVKPHERVAQIVFTHAETDIDLELADELSETERGDCGFGSTGAN